METNSDNLCPTYSPILYSTTYMYTGRAANVHVLRARLSACRFSLEWPAEHRESIESAAGLGQQSLSEYAIGF